MWPWIPRFLSAHKQAGAAERARRALFIANWLCILRQFVVVVAKDHVPGSEEFSVALGETYKAVHLQYARGFKPDEQLLCASAGVHGLMQKQAFGSQIPRLAAWKSAKVKTPHGIPIYAGPSVFVSDKYQFIYVRQQKSASSTLLAALTKTFCTNGVCKPSELVLQRGGVPDDIWQRYFVFTWVRNPLLRMASCYHFLCDKMLRTRYSRQSLPGPRCCVPFEDFVESPAVMVSICSDHSCCVYNEWGKPPDWDPRFVQGHLNDQSHTIFTLDGRSMVDYIGRSEHLVQDWQELLQQLRNRTGMHIQDYELEGKNQAEVAHGVAMHCGDRRVETISSLSLRRLAMAYSMDMMRLKYDPTAPPIADPN